MTLAADGMEGVRLACAQPWDVVLLDLLLPDIPGAAALTAMLKARPDLRVMVVSCVGDTETRVSCLELRRRRLHREAVLEHRAGRPGSVTTGSPARPQHGRPASCRERLRLDLGRTGRWSSTESAIELSPREVTPRPAPRCARTGRACTREELPPTGLGLRIRARRRRRRPHRFRGSGAKLPASSSGRWGMARYALAAN